MGTERVPTPREIDELLAFLPAFEDPAEPVAEWSKGSVEWESKRATLSYPSYSDAVMAFHRLIHQPQWLHIGYQDERPKDLAENPDRIPSATLDQITALLTWVVRGERFCDGHMDSCFNLGIPQAALRRLAELRNELRPITVAGADVAKGSWVVVTLDDGRFHRALVVDHLIQLRSRLGAHDLLAVDIPIGLPQGGGDWPRPADLAARELLGPRRSSVFHAPPRPVFDRESYASGNALHRELTGKGISRQSWGLRDRVLEAEFYVSKNPKTIEVHPEVCFRAMKGMPLEYAKKTWNGQMERRALLAAQGIELPDHLDGPTGKVPPDDLLDAAAAAWTAWRCATGRGEALSGSDSKPSLTERGVIWS